MKGEDTRNDRRAAPPVGKDSLDAAYLVGGIVDLVTAPLVQTDFGSESFRYGWVTLLGMVWWAGQSGSEAVLLYAGVWLVALACQRARTTLLLRSGAVMHTRQAGRSWLVRLLLPWVRRERTAKVVEGLGCLVGGSLLAALSVPLGTMIVCVSFTNFFGLAVDAEARRREREAASDRRIEAAYRASLWRGEEDDY